MNAKAENPKGKKGMKTREDAHGTLPGELVKTTDGTSHLSIVATPCIDIWVRLQSRSGRTPVHPVGWTVGRFVLS
jgi:hypothetical protein